MDKRPAPQRRSTRPTKAGPTLSLSLRRPDLARDWHPTKNGLLTLDQCAANNTHPVWWQCHQNPHHVWRASVKSRYSKRTGCRRCTLAVRAWNNESFHTRTLSRKSPELAATWHPTKNGTLTPNSVTFNSRQRVWWQCPSNPTHVWDTTVNNRQRSNCPFCAGRFHRAIDARHRWQDPISVAHRELMRHASHVIKSYMAVHRNVAAELQAVIHGLTHCRQTGHQTVTVFYDYAGIEQWASGRWKANTRTTQEYVRSIADCPLMITWQKVPAHSGIPMNELVDQLATGAAHASNEYHSV